MNNKSVESFRSPYENDNEWNLRKKFLENNSNKFPTDRLVCLSMCYINNVSYGVTYSPGVMSQLKELAHGLTTHVDIVKEKNSIAFVKAEEKANNNGCKYGNFIKSKDAPDDNNGASNTETTTSKYTNFVHSSASSYPKTFHQPGAGLGFGNGNSGSTDNSTKTNSVRDSKYPGFIKSGSTGSESSRPCFPTTTETATNILKYPGFVKSGSTASDNSKSCFSTTENVTNMFDYPGYPKSGSNISPVENSSNTSSNINNNKYLKMMKPTPNSYVGSQANMLSSKYRSKPGLKAPQVSPNSKSIGPPLAKKALLTIPPRAAASNSTCSQESVGTGDVEITSLEKKFYALSVSLKTTKVSSSAINAIQILNMANSKLKLFIDTDIMPSLYKMSTIFRCKVRIMDVKVGEGTGSTKKAAKLVAFTRTLELLAKPTLTIQDQNGQQVLVGSDLPRSQQSKMTVSKPASTPAAVPNTANHARKRPMSSWGTFLIMENKLVNNALAVMRHSADFNKMPVEYVCTPDPQGSACQLLINDEPIIECVGENKTVAKLAAAEKALVWLKQRCWTIVIKQTADSDNIDVTRDKIMGEIEKQFKPIGSDNIGNQLLRKMGWEGGGIGAEGNKGIEDPITVNQVIDRQGLGCRTSSGVSTKFDAQIRDILLRYVKSKKQQDLVFTSEFNKDERAIIHKEARRYNLKSVSRGGGEERYMIISRKRSAGQLFNHILSSGGSTEKYELIPPLNKNL